MTITHLMLKKIIFFISILFFSAIVRAQIPAQRQLSTALTGDFPATQSITLLPGFSTSGPFRAYITSGLDQPLVSAPSQDQNYILTSTIKKAGVTDAGGLAGLSVSELNQTVAYFDGLGRPLQTITIQGSPGFADMVQPFAYDVFGREEKKYGAYSAATTGGAYRSNALVSGTGLSAFYGSIQPGMTSTTFPYSQTVFEASPLNRVTEQGAPGASWQPVSGSEAGHTVKLSYGTNNSLTTYATTGFGVRLYRADAVTTAGHEHERTLSTNGLYAPNQLYLTVSRDENWKPGDVKAGTTEEYKDKEGHVVLKRTFNVIPTGTEVLSTYYVYDDFGNLSFVLPPQATPDVSVTAAALADYCFQYRYDGRQRLIEKWIPGTTQWASMVYNKLDQLIFMQDGRQAGAATKKWHYTKYDALGRVIITGIFTSTSTTTTRAQLQDIADARTGNFWETRSGSSEYTNLAIPTATANVAYVTNYYDDYAFPDGNTYTYSGSQRTKGLLTGSKVRVIGGSQPTLLSLNFYDDEGRMVKSYKQHNLSGAQNTANYDELLNTYNFASELTASARVHHVGSALTTIVNTYTYDHVGRKLASSSSINGDTPVILSKLEYNEVGQLRKKWLHSTDNGNTFLQNSRYTYNERGWMKTDSSAQFNFELKYQDGTVPQYNGNIAGQSWNTDVTPLNTFTYSYDKLNRLLSGIKSGTAMSEVLTYDKMGNIGTMNRDDVGASTYSYAGNRLTSVSSGPLATGSYQYDSGGNVTLDGRTGVAMSYMELGLPYKATKTGSVDLTYVYDGMGNKLSRATGTTVTRNYIDGIEYNGTAIDIIHTEEGVARRNGTVYSYEYNLTDHLGNVRYSFNKNPVTGAPARLAETNYYPFGKAKFVAEGVNKYLYNGKELQDELGQLDYGARFYDPVIGRWNVIDPKAELGRRWSPYAYAFDNPIYFVDPDGMWPGPGFFGNVWNSAKSSFNNTFKGLGNAILHPIVTAKAVYNNVSSMSAGDIALGYVKTQPGIQTIRTVLGAGKAVVNGDGKSLGNIIGGQAANTVLAVATEGVGAAIGKAAGSLKGAAGATENMTSLYRGVNEGHPGFENAVNGVAEPIGGSASAGAHNAGNTQSPFTSWTTNPDVATNYALRPNGSGVVMEVSVPQSGTVASPSLKNVNLIQRPGTVVNESEVLLRGTVSGAKVRRTN